MTDWVHPEHREVHELLRNWSAWARPRRHFRTCGSAEKYYRSPQHWYPLEPKPPDPKLDDAYRVEGCMRHMPAGLRKLLVAKYVLRGDQSWCCRTLKLKYHRYEEILYRARQVVWELLTRPRFYGICSETIQNDGASSRCRNGPVGDQLASKKHTADWLPATLALETE